MRTRSLALALILFSTFTVAQDNSAPKELLGTWDASLNNGTEGVFFRLEVKQHDGNLEAAVLNGTERMPFTRAQFANGVLTLRFEQYDGTLTAKLDGTAAGAKLNGKDDHGRLTGEYSRPYAKGTVQYPFVAVPTLSEQSAMELGLRLPPHLPVTVPEVWDEGHPYSPHVMSATGFTGEWLYKLLDTKGQPLETGVAELHIDDTAKATGTLIPVSGDTGLLAGEATLTELNGQRVSSSFYLTRFDGIHVMLLKGDIQPDGSLGGQFESGKTARYTFTATRKEAAKKEDQPEDPFALTKVKDPSEPFRFSAPDPRTGKAVSASDPEFKNKVIIVDIMGTWCPNCHDEEPLLVDLYNRYHKDGLEIVGLAYEYTDDAARNARQIEIFRKKYNVPYPILIAGTTDDGQVQKTLPQLVNFGAFPTTIFIARDGRVSKIHAGYTGPATGERFPQVQKELDQIVRDLLKTAATTAAR
ncbi:MAG: peroxiredoxin family protein [Terriglobales bacterium]